MAYPVILYGPESEVYNQYTAVSPAPGDNGIGGAIAYRGRLPVGKQLILEDGRKYRFTRAGELLVVGNVLQGPIPISTDASMACAVGVVGDRIITFTHGAATTVINFFAEGYANISLAPGSGQVYKIASHAALRNATAGDIVNLAPGQALRVALTTTSDLTLVNHVNDGVIQMPITPTACLAGVAIAAIASGSFGWVQTRGIASVLSAASTVNGNNVGSLLTGGTAGAVAPLSAATQPVVGIAQVAEGTAEWGAIWLMIDG
jgi:hypothetical protein